MTCLLSFFLFIFVGIFSSRHFSPSLVSSSSAVAQENTATQSRELKMELETRRETYL